MLQQFEHLATTTDRRYASDAELVFLQTYLRTAWLRFTLYQKIQAIEAKLVQQVLSQIKMTRPDLMMMGHTDMTAKWQRDTIRIVRYAAAALLIDDADLFRDRVLIWFETVMRSFKVQKNCEETYKIMAAVARQLLTAEEADLFCPLLEMSQIVLSNGQPSAS